ncbi:MAG: DUF4827 domain-containing protein, partial [Bacteroidales bacterium]|nr:DUF4827 domain-containing protein [Bacteroidales bacterium]
NGDNVNIRFKGLEYLCNSDTTVYSNINNKDPEVLTYGNSSTYQSSAWTVPMKNVGYSGKVKIIVPFNMGLPNDQQYYKTAYYKEIEYKYWHGVTVVK